MSDIVWGPFVLCHKCPFVYRCPVEQAAALRYIKTREGTLIPKEEEAKFHGAMELAKKAAGACPVVKGWNPPPARPCLVKDLPSAAQLRSPDQYPNLAPVQCKQYGSDCCRWNSDAIVDCPYMRGDDVDVTEWEPDG